ncbi:hypothetical protein C806_02393 [Lachnospiraceae bacterium 3-1]|nr:hypothetical protein C806_02393 [Lachnospiraceae bacterium 3-1]
MKQRKLLTVILGIAIFASILCSGIIITTGIQAENASISNASVQKRSFPKPHTLKKTKIEEFSEASIQLEDGNISILPSDGFYLEYRLDGICEEPDYEISDGKFYFQEGPALKQYGISFHLFGNPSNQEPFYLNLYVPKDQYFEFLFLSSQSGNMELEQVNAQEAEFYLSYGNLNLQEFTGDTLNISAESGNITSEHITCEDLSIFSSYGNLTADVISVSHVANLNLESGNLTLSQLESDTLSVDMEYGTCTIDSIANKTGKIYMDSGNLNLKAATLETMNIKSEYGNVTLQLADEFSDHNYDLQTEYGTLKVDGKTIKVKEDGTVSYQKQQDANTGNIQIYCESGAVTVK